MGRKATIWMLAFLGMVSAPITAVMLSEWYKGYEIGFFLSGIVLFIGCYSVAKIETREIDRKEKEHNYWIDQTIKGGN